MGVKVTGDDLGKQFQKVIVQAVEQASQEAMNDVGDLIQRKASKDAPLDTGKLRLSIYKKIHQWRHRKKTTVEIGSMGAVDRENGERYAVIQHETAEFNHPKGGRWKYIERNAYESVFYIRRKVVAKMRKHLRRLSK